MANLSPDERIIITKYPLHNSLDLLGEPLQKLERTYKPGSLSYDGAVDSYDRGPQKVTLRLLTTLMGHEVAFSLRSKTGSENIASELSTLFRRV